MDFSTRRISLGSGQVQWNCTFFTLNDIEPTANTYKLTLAIKALIKTIKPIGNDIFVSIHPVNIN